VTGRYASKKSNMLKLKAELDIRFFCARFAAVMGILGAVCFLIGQPYVSGVTLCVSSIVLMAMSIGYKQIDLVCKWIKMRLKK
jgi:hypothetical protein